MTNVITIATPLCNNLISVSTNGELVTLLTMPCPERPLITVIGCNGILETDPFWHADKPNYYTIREIDDLFIAKAPVNADWNAIEGLSMILNKPDLSVYLTIDNAIATYVPLSRVLTINGVAKTLDSDPVWDVGTVLQVKALYPLTGGVITAVGQIGIPQASNITDGYLSAADWIAFNNKAEQGYYSERISGGVVTWAGTGLQYNVSACSYYIAGVHYDSVAQVTASPPADPDFDRIDVVALDIHGDAVVIVGVPSSNPEVPQVDPSSQIALTSIHLAAGATTPSDITEEVIYDENTEWAHTVTSVTANFDDTTLPYHLSKAVNVSSYSSAANRTITFIRNSVFSMAPGTVLLFRIRLKGAYATNSNIVLKWGSGSGSMVTAGLTLAATHGFNKTTTGVYQLITVPISSFNFSNINVDRLRIALIGSGAGFYLDQILLQGGLISSGLSGVTSFNSRTGNVMPVAGDYATFYPSLSVAYNNPTWIATLDYSKLINVPPNPGVTASPLSTTDDINISLGLSGTPATALLQSVNIAVAWVGTLDDSRIASASIWNAKQDTFALGTVTDYFRGDLTLAPFPTTVSYFVNDAGYLTAVPDLQTVTDVGATTTNSITIGNDFPSLFISDTTAGSNAHILLECNNPGVGGGTTGFIALANTAGTRGYIMATNLTNGFGIKLQLPNYAGNFTRTLPVSVNGTFADTAGDISITVGATGAAGGDLSGTYPNPTVAWANGYTTYDARYFRAPIVYIGAATSFPTYNNTNASLIIFNDETVPYDTVKGNKSSGIYQWDASTGDYNGLTGKWKLVAYTPNVELSSTTRAYYHTPALQVWKNYAEGNSTHPPTFFLLHNDSADMPTGSYVNGAMISGNGYGGAINFHAGLSDSSNRKLRLGLIDNNGLFIDGLEVHYSSTGNTLINRMPMTPATTGTQSVGSATLPFGTGFFNNVVINATLKDTSGSVGTSGQILSSTVTGTSWISLSGAPTGVAGGDLGGTYPNPTVSWANGYSTYDTRYGSEDIYNYFNLF